MPHSFDFLRRKSRQGSQALIDALGEAAALCALDGTIVAANLAWRESLGEAARLPDGAPGLFAALLKARRGERAEVALRRGGAEIRLSVVAVSSTRLLLREISAPGPPPRQRVPRKPPRRRVPR